MSAVDVVRKLEQTAESLSANRRQVATELRALAAELGVTTAYNRCLFCNNDYGSPGRPQSTYIPLMAACGCTGVGEDCLTGGHRLSGTQRVFGCGLRAIDMKCFKCRMFPNEQ